MNTDAKEKIMDWGGSTGPDTYQVYTYTGNETEEQLEWVRHWLHHDLAVRIQKYAAPLPNWPESN